MFYLHSYIPHNHKNFLSTCYYYHNNTAYNLLLLHTPVLVPSKSLVTLHPLFVLCLFDFPFHHNYILLLFFHLHCFSYLAHLLPFSTCRRCRRYSLLSFRICQLLTTGSRPGSSCSCTPSMFPLCSAAGLPMFGCLPFSASCFRCTRSSLPLCFRWFSFLSGSRFHHNYTLPPARFPGYPLPLSSFPDSHSYSLCSDFLRWLSSVLVLFGSRLYRMNSSAFLLLCGFLLSLVLFCRNCRLLWPLRLLCSAALCLCLRMCRLLSPFLRLFRLLLTTGCLFRYTHLLSLFRFCLFCLQYFRYYHMYNFRCTPLGLCSISVCFDCHTHMLCLLLLLRLLPLLSFLLCFRFRHTHTMSLPARLCMFLPVCSYCRTHNTHFCTSPFLPAYCLLCSLLLRFRYCHKCSFLCCLRRLFCSLLLSVFQSHHTLPNSHFSLDLLSLLPVPACSFLLW